MLPAACSNVLDVLLDLCRERLENGRGVLSRALRERPRRQGPRRSTVFSSRRFLRACARADYGWFFSSCIGVLTVIANEEDVGFAFHWTLSFAANLFSYRPQAPRRGRSTKVCLVPADSCGC